MRATTLSLQPLGWFILEKIALITWKVHAITLSVQAIYVFYIRDKIYQYTSSKQFTTESRFATPHEPKVLKQLQPHPVAHSMLEHVALADNVEEHGEAGHLAEAGTIEGLEIEAAETAWVSHRTHAPSNSIRSKFQCRGTGL